MVGLLHDLGKIVFDLYFADYFGAGFQRIGQGNITIGQAERDIPGVDHKEIGDQLATAWKFSDNDSSYIFHHQEPDSTDRYARLVRVDPYRELHLPSA
ncbi:TPA: hypothetical protein DCE37_26685 [Candidatus Latescibacteria bacterium]|nr:hypothetical protein [Candidatus Latescibacterota bacterium]